MSDVVPKSEYEGAGFLLKYRGHVILAERINAKNPSVAEFEYMGGKREKGIDKDDYATAVAELIEELGGPQFDTLTWRDRCKTVEVFQPFTKKWIICRVLELNDAEFEIVKDANLRLQSWPEDEMRDYSQMTGRSAPVRKAVRALYLVPEKKFYAYFQMFAKYPRSDNRMNDAKEFGKTNQLDGYCMITGAIKTLPLRGFNTVLFEKDFGWSFQFPTYKNYNKIYATVGLTVFAIGLGYYFYTQ